jgi:NADH-quinone oxidoreductase subunit C
MTTGGAPKDFWTGWLVENLETRAEVGSRFGDVTVSVDPSEWVALLTELRDRAGLTYFDWLSAVDEGDGRFTVFCHLYDPEERRHALARTEVSAVPPTLPSATPVFRGAAWHERETAEMFGIGFTGHPQLKRLLLSDDFDGYPLRKDFVLTARVSKSWPGAKEPGESGDGSPSRRKMQPPGVPDPAWGPRESGGANA